MFPKFVETDVTPTAFWFLNVSVAGKNNKIIAKNKTCSSKLNKCEYILKNKDFRIFLYLSKIILIEGNLFEMPKIGKDLLNRDKVFRCLGFIKINSGD